MEIKPQSPVRSHQLFVIALVVANIAVALILAGIVTHFLLRSRELYVERAKQTSTNLSHVLALTLGAQIKQIDNVLQTVAFQLRDQPISTAGSSESTLDTLKVQTALVPFVDVVRLTDAAGTVVNSEKHISVGDRDYFKKARMSPGELVISEPLEGRLIKKWGVVLARAITDPKGNFKGVAYANLQSDRITDEFDDLSLGPHGAVSLRSSTLHLIARYSPGAKDQHYKLGTNETSAEFREALARSPEAGAFVSVALVDGAERSSAYERVTGFSPIVIVGVATSDFMAPWLTEVRNDVLFACLLELGIISLSIWAAVQNRTKSIADRQMHRLSEERRLLLDNQLVGMVKLKNRTELWHNRAMTTLLGYPDSELNGAPARLLYDDDETYAAVGASYARLQEQGQLRTRVRMRRKDGELLWIDLSGANLGDGESLWMLVDITEAVNSEKHSKHRADHDALTGLMNRAAVLKSLETILGDAPNGTLEIAVCFVDLDGFKAINDRHGHEAGDRVLKHIGERLQSTVRGGDLVARLGGDEFVVVLCNLHGAHEVCAVAERMVSKLSQPIGLRGSVEVSVSASIGIAIYPYHGTGVEALIKRADAAMYLAKREGKNRFEVFSDESTEVDWRHVGLTEPIGTASNQHSSVS